MPHRKPRLRRPQLPALRWLGAVGLSWCALTACTSSDPEPLPTPTPAATAPGSGGGTTSSTSTSSTGGGDVGLPAGCWTGATECDPFTNGSCAEGEACDVGVDDNGMSGLTCFSPPNSQALGQRCDASAGPFCAGGGTCAPTGVCVPFCCSEADCDGTPCTPFDPNQGTLGGCFEPPMCQGPGGPCSQPSDCCSNDCHLDHCH